MYWQHSSDGEGNALIVLLALLWVLNAVFVIIATIKASDRNFYRYPMTIRFMNNLRLARKGGKS